MEIKEMTIEQIEERMLEIRSMNFEKIEDIQAIDKEVDALNERKQALKNEAQAKVELRNKVLESTETTTVEKPKEERTMDLNKENYLSSKEYRSAFLKNLQGKELSVEERSALNLSGADPIIPEKMQADILSKVKEYAPILNDITLLNVNGAVKFAVEGENAEAELHEGNTAISASENTFVEVTLSTYEIAKLVQISASVKSMSIESFEAWLTQMLVEAVAIKIEKLIFNGSGSAQAQGINSITWNATNSVTASGALTAKNVYDLFGLLKSGYARTAKIYMNRKTLYGSFMPLMDNAKHNLVTEQGGKYYVLGTQAELTDSMADGEAILGAPKKYVANLAEAITVKNAYDINTNSFKYLGVANFDGKVAIEEAFVKLVKGA